jgi:hypothetical protein
VEYVTRGGYRLKIGRVPRQRIDQFVASHPMPDPPTKTVEVWGEIPEEVPDYDDPAYKQKLLAFYADFGFGQLELITEAVQVLPGADSVSDLYAMGLIQTKTSPLPFVTRNRAELQDIVEEVFYNSTVTPRGIYEAAQLFGVRWRGGLINPLAIPPTGATANGVYGDRLAARWHGYRDWDAFCELSGPRQSEIVALYRIDNRLQVLMARGT